MKQREQLSQRSGAGSGEPEPDDKLTEARDQADQLFAAADRAFNRVRSEDSLSFLSQVRQSGGQ